MLSTREPSGAAGWPMILVEGREGTRKTSESLRLSADPRIGDAYVIEVGERRVDEYATLGNFAVVEHDGHLRTIVPAIREVMALPPREGRPNLLIIDSGTHLWDLVKRHAEALARSSKRAKEQIAAGEAAGEHVEIEVGHQAWNRAKDPWWWSWLNDLRAWPGVFVMTARSDEVSKFVDGRPVANQTDYRVDVERGSPFIFDATVRMRGAASALVTTAKSLHFTVPAAGLELPTELPLVHLVFDLFKPETNIVLSTVQAKSALMAVARSTGLDDEQAKVAAAEAWKRASGQRGEFDHRAMADLIAALDAPPDPAAATSPSESAESPPEPSGGAPGPDGTAAQQSATGEHTEAGDWAAWDAADDETRANAQAQVRNMLAGEVDAQLESLGLPKSGKVDERRERLARRILRLRRESEAA